jgi:uncharacterized membrane protein YbaN (DUF454 family)
MEENTKITTESLFKKRKRQTIGIILIVIGVIGIILPIIPGIPILILGIWYLYNKKKDKLKEDKQTNDKRANS